ncbi:MAG: cyclic nucleotide-binding domain-containing protein [Blastochloris sp.]|nr:cyclic nucleotide-binding domain-containing protein [Blastochloris sp.]
MVAPLLESKESKLEKGEPLSGEDLLRYLPALSEVPKGVFTKFAEGAAVLRRFKPGEMVCREGDFDSTAFYIVSGSVDIFISTPLAHVATRAERGGFFQRSVARMRSLLQQGERSPEDTVGRRKLIPIDASVDLEVGSPSAQLGAGELFGEMCCRSFQPRSATVRAREECVMVEMLRVVLDMLVGTREIQDDIKSSTKVKAATFKGTSFKTELDKKYMSRALLNQIQRIPIFESLSQEFLQEMCSHASLQTFHKNQVICREDDPADCFYLIRQGLVKVSQAMPGGEMVRTYLSKGDYFGEIALLKNMPRTASCTAVDTVDLVRIAATDFQNMVEKFPEVRSAMEEVADQRMKSGAMRKFPNLPMSSSLSDAMDLGLLQAQNLLLIDLNKCTRCDLCVQACGEAHDGVTRLLRDGMRYENYLVATACRSCQDPLCMTQCPVGSIRRKVNLEIVIEDWCIGCTKCAELCPYGNINMHPVEIKEEKPSKDSAAPAKKAASATKATTCDLCTDLKTPSCVYACPHDAAMRVNPADFFSRKMPGLRNVFFNVTSTEKVGARTTH